VINIMSRAVDDSGWLESPMPANVSTFASSSSTLAANFGSLPSPADAGGRKRGHHHHHHRQEKSDGVASNSILVELVFL
jgi:hypothetical protein